MKNNNEDINAVKTEEKSLDIKKAIVKSYRNKNVIKSSIAVSLVAIMAVNVYASAAEVSHSEPENIYKEEVVEIGDIVVGVTEMGTANLKAVETSLDYDVTLDEVLVKSGQYVNEGDLIARVSEDEDEGAQMSYQEEYDAKISELNTAELDLEKAELMGEKNVLDAQTALENSTATGANAATIQSYSLADLQKGLEKIANEITTLQAEKTQIETEIAGGYKGESVAPKTDEAEAINSEIPSADDAGEQAWLKQLQDRLGVVTQTIASKTLDKEQYEITMQIKTNEINSSYSKDIYNSDNASKVYTNSISTIENDIIKAQEKVAQVQEDIASLETLVVGAEILAEKSGYIMSIAEESKVKAGMAVVSIADTELVNVLVSIPQEDIAEIKIGMETNVKFDAYEGVTIPAIVDSISIIPAEGMQTTVNYTVTILCDITEFADMVIYEGMTSDVTFVQKQKKDVLVVSNKCITNQDGKQYVKVKNTAGEIEMVEVETGFSDGFDVEIIAGVKADDTVIIESVVNASAAQ